MEVEQLTIPQKRAQAEFKALKQVFKSNAKLHQEQVYRELQRVYGHMRHGKKVIDVYDAFKRAGLNEAGDPKLAICRADGKQCYCVKHDDDAAIFSMKPFDWQHKHNRNRGRKTYNDVYLPAGTFNFPKEYSSPKNRYVEALVPIIPAHILIKEVKVLLKNFHILWEVEEWKPVPPRDPILVKQLTNNLFGVLATWDLTPLERAVIKGHITEV